MKPGIVFMGTPEFAVPALRRLAEDGYPILAVVCQPDKPIGRHQVMTAPPVKQAAQELGLLVLQPEKIRTGELMAQLRSLSPDLIVTAAYGRILPREILDIPAHGCLNIHGSLLPAYRGAAPVQRCIIDGCQETGITIMVMDEGMDTGPILLQEKVPVPLTMDAGQLMRELAGLGARLLPDAIEGYLAGTLQPLPQDDSRATYAPLITRETGRIDWRASALAIHNLVRGTQPWPGAFTTFPDGRLLKIHRTHPVMDMDLAVPARTAPPGTVIAASPAGITVATGDGALNLLEIQPQNGRRLSCRDCAHNYPVGLHFGGA